MTLQTLSIDSEDVLGTNYIVTSLTVSNYNPTIDSTVTVTVTLKDVYNDPVVGEEVTVTASEGNFTQYNGSTITGASSYTGTTNSSGQFTLTYNCSEWGLITFSANNENIQIKVTGWKQVAQTTVSGVTYTCYVNGEGVGRVTVKCSNVSFAAGNSHEALNWIPEAYKPIGECEVLTERKTTDTLIIYLWEYQTLIGITNTGSSAKTKTLSSTIVYSY